MAFRQLGEFEFENFASLPDQGEENIIYHVTDTGKRYRYIRGAYIPYFQELFQVITGMINNNWQLITLPIDLTNRTIKVNILNEKGNEKNNGVREVGSTENRVIEIPTGSIIDMKVRVDSNNQIEIFSEKYNQVTFTIISAEI